MNEVCQYGYNTLSCILWPRVFSEIGKIIWGFIIISNAKIEESSNRLESTKHEVEHNTLKHITGKNIPDDFVVI